MDCQRDLARAIGAVADGLGQRDDCYDLGDAMNILQGVRYHMPGRQWQMLDDMVARETDAEVRACCPQGDRARSGKFGWRIAEHRPRWSRCRGRSS